MEKKSFPSRRPDAPSSRSRAPNPKVFDRSMRKPSMRFGRAGASNPAGGASEKASPSEGGADTLNEEEHEDENVADADAEGKRNKENKENKGGEKGVVRQGKQSEQGVTVTPKRLPSGIIPVRDRDRRGRHRRRENEGGAGKRSSAAIGKIPSMSDAALKELIETTLNEEHSAKAPMLRTSTRAPSSLKVAAMGRVIIPSTKGTSMPKGANGRDKHRISRSRVHAVCLVMEDQAHPAGHYWVGSVRDVTVNPGPEGDAKSVTVVTNRGWSMKSLSGVEKREKEDAVFTLLFESSSSGGAGTSSVGKESSYTWEAVSVAACDEILWALLTLYRAMRHENDAFEAVHVSLKELDATAVYHGLATKHPLVPKLARQMRHEERSGIGRDSTGESGGRRGSRDSGNMPRRGHGGGVIRREGASRNIGDKSRRGKGGSPWDYEEFEQGEAVLSRLKWLEKGKEGLLEELSEELDALEGGTIQQLIAWSQKTDETENLISLLDEVDKQLEIMEGWLEEHGKPLEEMQVDMAEIELKNNKLDVQWRNYQNLFEYLNNLVEAISISPENESTLRNPQVVLDAVLTNAEDDPTSAVEKVVTAAEALSSALASTEQLAGHESTSSLQLLADQRAKLMGLTEVTCSQLAGFCRRLLKRLTTQEGTAADGGPELKRHASITGDTTNQRLLQAQRQFHGYLIDYEPIFAQVRKLEGAGGRRSTELQQAYGEDLSQGFLKARIKAYFADLLPRVVFRHGSPGMVNTERAAIGESVGQSPKASSPTIGLVQISPVQALRQCLEHTMPAISREEAFFCTLFGLNPAKDPGAREAAHRVLEVGFAELKSSYKRIATEVADNSLDTLGALTLVVETQSKQKGHQNSASMAVLPEFKAMLVQRFNRFIEDQASWIQSQKGDAKKAGILSAVAKLPSFIGKHQSAAIAAVGSGGGREEVPEAQKAYQMLVTLLFKHIDDVAVSNPKYEHIVKLENYHFFAATIRPLKVKCLEEYVVQAEGLADVATTRYLEWLVGYQFPHLTQFFARVEDLVTTVGAADVSYHEPRRNLENTLKKQGDMKVVMEGLRATHQRMLKHLSREGRLMWPLWDKLSDTLFAMFSRYEELCTMCYQHTLDPGAMDVKRAATEIGGNATGSGTLSPPRRGLGSSRAGGSSVGDGDLGLESPPSSPGVFPHETSGSFSSVPSPTHAGRRESGAFGGGHLRSGSNGMGRLSGPQMGGRVLSPGPGGADSYNQSSPLGVGGGSGGGTAAPLSPMHKGKKFLAKHLRMH